MKIFFFILLMSLQVLGQNTPNTEIYLFDISTDVNVPQIENGENISQNPGYDNQPAFYENDILIYARNRNGQTDISGLDLRTNEEFWLCNTSGRGEYSPQRILETENIAAVGLDTTGLQLLYKYDFKTEENSILLPEAKIGYFTFLNKNMIIAAVLKEGAMDLISHDLETNLSEFLISNVGRSIHKVPGETSISYTIRNGEQKNELYIIDLQGEDLKSFFVCTLPAGTEDYVWFDENRILAGDGSKLMLFDLFNSDQWTEVADLSKYGIKTISRMAVNPKLTKIAITAELKN